MTSLTPSEVDRDEMGASLRDRAVAASPSSRKGVSPVPASIPSADAWRLDSPPFGKRPIWQYVWLQGECEHSGELWFRQGWGTAGIRPNDAPDGLLGYRRADIERICRDNDIELWSVRVVAWLPMTPPALLNLGMRPALQPCDDGEWSAQAIEARRAETAKTGSVEDESAVPKGCAHPSPSQPPNTPGAPS